MFLASFNKRMDTKVWYVMKNETYLKNHLKIIKNVRDFSYLEHVFALRNLHFHNFHKLQGICIFILNFW